MGVPLGYPSLQTDSITNRVVITVGMLDYLTVSVAFSNQPRFRPDTKSLTSTNLANRPIYVPRDLPLGTTVDHVTL